MTPEFFSQQRLLVLAPHADDEVIGSGGLMARVKAAGGEVYVQVFTVGDLDHYNGNHENTSTSAQTRISELDKAMACLSVDDYEVIYRCTEKHLRLDQVPRRDLVHDIEKKGKLAIDKTKPTMVVLPAPSYNQDHEAVFRAGLTACRPHMASLKPFQGLVLVADAPQLCWYDKAFKPNFYVDITDFLEKKLEAFRCHASQQRPDPHNGGEEALRYLAMTRGREISIQAAEAYHCLRCVV